MSRQIAKKNSPSIRQPGKQRKVDLSHAITMKMRGLSYQEIADHFQTDKANVFRQLKPFFGKESCVPAYKEHRADILAGVQLRVLEGITDADIKKADLRSKAIMFGTLYDKERLERGQSTQNIAAFCASAVIQAHQDSESVATISATIVEATDVSSGND